MNRSLIKLYSLVLIVILFICNTGNTDAQSLKQSINSLKGVSKAGVIVEKVNQVLNDNGINEDTILKDAVEKLDSAGMTVVDKSAMHSLPGAPYLYINIGAIKSKIADVYCGQPDYRIQAGCKFKPESKTGIFRRCYLVFYRCRHFQCR